jgi:hypothetical protein
MKIRHQVITDFGYNKYVRSYWHNEEGWAKRRGCLSIWHLGDTHIISTNEEGDTI